MTVNTAIESIKLDEKVFITPDLARGILSFLSRSQIQGSEADAMVVIKDILKQIITQG